MRVLYISCEGTSFLEPNAHVHVLCWLKCWVSSCFQAKTLIASLTRSFDDDGKYGTTRTPATKTLWCAHGLDFSMYGGQFLERTASEQHFIFPGSPESDLWGLQLGQIQCENLFGWTQFVHIGQVLFQEFMNRLTRKVVDFYSHSEVIAVG